MTRDEVLAQWDSMTPYERNAIVAEKVLGFKHYVGVEVPEAQRHSRHPVEAQEIWAIEKPYREFYCKWCGDLPMYTEDMGEAYKVITRLRDMWAEATKDLDALSGDFVRPFDDAAFFDSLHRHADRRWPWAFLYATPEAICLAAIKAVRWSDEG